MQGALARVFVIVLFVWVCFTLGAFVLAQGALKLIKVILDGETISARGRLIGSEVYVPVSDIAKANRWQVVGLDRKTATLTLRKETPGAKQLEAAEGKVGEWLFNGWARVRVTEVTFPEKDFEGREPPEGYKLVRAKIELRNTLKDVVEVLATWNFFILADAQDVTKPSISTRVVPGGLHGQHVVPAGAAMGEVWWEVPADFQPIKVLMRVECYGFEAAKTQWLRVFLEPPKLSEGAGQ